MSTYSPELGQSVFGAKWEEHDADWATHGLYALTEALAKRFPDHADEGYGYYDPGFRNEVFVLRAYWWGDCTCGFDANEAAWSEAHKHAPECWTSRWDAEEKRLGEPAWGSKRHQRLYEWAFANGWPKDEDGGPAPGVAVFCDCGHDKEYAAWREAGNDHAPDCKEVLPNFEHFASGLVIHWYKYVGRGMSANMKAPKDWDLILAECLRSLEAAP